MGTALAEELALGAALADEPAEEFAPDAWLAEELALEGALADGALLSVPGTFELAALVVEGVSDTSSDVFSALFEETV